MNTSGDAAEQVVRLSIEGVEVAAKLTGAGVKNLAILLATVLKEEQKTMGKARLTNMIKTGKELAVFSVEKKDLRKFSKEANRYGVLYCVVKSKYGKSGRELIDVIARAEDGAKINRIVEKLEMAVVERGKIVKSVEKEEPYQDIKKEKTKGGIEQEGKKSTMVMGAKEHQSELHLEKERNSGIRSDLGYEPILETTQESKRKSVRERLLGYQRILKLKEEEKVKILTEPEKKLTKPSQPVQLQPGDKIRIMGRGRGLGEKADGKSR